MIEPAARLLTRLPKLRNNIRLVRRCEPPVLIRFGVEGYKMWNFPAKWLCISIVFT